VGRKIGMVLGESLEKSDTFGKLWWVEGGLEKLLNNFTTFFRPRTPSRRF
jgi:hypothetical protein